MRSSRPLVTPAIGTAAAGDARQLASRFPFTATDCADLASDDEAMAAEPANEYAVTNTTAAHAAGCSWILVAIPSSRRFDKLSRLPRLPIAADTARAPTTKLGRHGQRGAESATLNRLREANTQAARRSDSGGRNLSCYV